MTLLDIPTPALVVDVRALERNIRRMADFFASRACALRPHFKAHKTPEIARLQLAAGSCAGLTCATVFEAEIAAPLTDNILIANEVIGSEACRRVATLATRATITIAIDSIAGLEEITARYEAEHDDYRSIIAKALADRLAEAFAEYLHEVARREWYEHGGKLSTEQLIAERFRGIRPAFGYPACPDHSEKR